MFENVNSQGITENIVIKDIYFVKKHDVDHAFAITDNMMVNNFLNYNLKSCLPSYYQ